MAAAAAATIIVATLLVIVGTAHSFSATMTVNSFQRGGDGGGPSECDGNFHRNSERVVALSTGWFAHRKRCGRNIMIHGNGHSVSAKVVDECDIHHGCRSDIVDASQGVWKALKVPNSKFGEMKVKWNDV